MIKDLEWVALATGLAEHGLAAVDVGAVVHVYDGGRSYRVEFTTFDWRTVAVAKVSADQIRPLGNKEIHHAHAFEPAARWLDGVESGKSTWTAYSVARCKHLVLTPPHPTAYHATLISNHQKLVEQADAADYIQKVEVKVISRRKAPPGK